MLILTPSLFTKDQQIFPGRPFNIWINDINKRLQGNRMWIKDYITHSTQVSSFVRSASTNSSGYLSFSEDSSFKGLTFVSFARLRTVPRTMYSPESTSCLTTCIAKKPEAPVTRTRDILHLVWGNQRIGVLWSADRRWLSSRSQDPLLHVTPAVKHVLFSHMPHLKWYGVLFLFIEKKRNRSVSLYHWNSLHKERFMSQARRTRHFARSAKRAWSVGLRGREKNDAFSSLGS